MPETIKRGRGRPSHVPTDETKRQVRSLASYGTKYLTICDIVGISEPTLKKHYRHILKTAEAEANAMVADSMFAQAVGRPAQYDERGNKIRAELPRNQRAGEFWLKNRAGWKETELPKASDNTIKVIVEGGMPDKGAYPVETEMRPQIAEGGDL